MDEIKEAQAKYRPDQIKVLFVGESLPVGGKYFYCGCNSLLRQVKRALGEEQTADVDFLIKLKQRGWYLDDLVRSRVKDPAELKKKCREARDDLAARIRDYNPSVVVCLLRRIRDDVEAAVLKAESNACIYAVSFPPQQSRRFQEEMTLLRPRLERLP
jgi:hypothetical protein